MQSKTDEYETGLIVECGGRDEKGGWWEAAAVCLTWGAILPSWVAVAEGLAVLLTIQGWAKGLGLRWC